MASFLYKCRRCGEIEKNPHCGDRFAFSLLVNVIHNLPITETQAPTLFAYHTCKNGGTGIADLLGFDNDNPAGKKDSLESPVN